MTTPIHFASLLEVADLIKTRQLSPVELTNTMLERIQAVDVTLHSYVTVMADHARAAAVRAENEIGVGHYRGPLHGIPLAIKDLVYTKGVRTMGGCGALADFVPSFDATVLTNLENAGAVLLGKLNLTEGAMVGYHPDFKVPVNPWGADFWPGGSSSGSGVAPAAGLCFAALGTDTGGSIRFPAMANGVVGLKPTYGRVSRYGVLALAESLDHIGPMTRRVADAAATLEAMAGFDPNDATSLNDPVPEILKSLGESIKGIRLGFDESYATEGVDLTLAASIYGAIEVLKSLGAEIVPVKMPDFTDGQLQVSWFAIASREAASAHSTTYPSQANKYGKYFAEFLAIGTSVNAEAYAQATAVRNHYSEQFRSVLASVDAVISPSGGVPFPIPLEVEYGGMEGFNPYMAAPAMRFTVPADFAGTPTITLPCGQSEAGIPHSVQLMGRHLGEQSLCQIAHAYEQATSWHARHPAV